MRIRTNHAAKRPIIIICALMMVVGSCVRFTFLDSKIFGNDEATTSIHVSGKTIAQYSEAMFDGRLRSARQLLVFQEPDRAHGIGDVIHSLAVEDPQHPPLYYIVERQWELIAGSSIAMRRILAAVFGVVGIVSAVWLGFEVFSLESGMIAGSLLAVSPFAIAYSQVAREYSLWLALTFISCALFIRALRDGRLRSWLLYGLAALAGLYTDALFSIVIVAQAAYLVISKPRGKTTFVHFAACLFFVALAYFPWIIALSSGYLHGTVTNNAYLGAALSPKPFVLKWIFNSGTLFYDADYIYPKSAILIIPGLIALALSIVACVRLRASKPAIGLLLVLGTVSFIVLFVPDLVHHEQRSTASRYLVPLWAACYEALGIGLSLGLRWSHPWIRAISFGFVIFTAATGLGSFMLSSKHDTWWTDGSTAPIGSIVRAIDRADKPIVVYHATWGPGTSGPSVWDFTVLMVADDVLPDTSFLQFSRDQSVTLPKSSGSILILDPSAATTSFLHARGARLVKIAGGSEEAVSAEIAALRRSVALERERQRAAVSLTPIPSLWAVEAR